MKRKKFEVSSRTRKGLYVTYDAYDALEYLMENSDGRIGLREVSRLYDRIKAEDSCHSSIGFSGDYGTYDSIKWTTEETE